jgi:hypothetical protein
LADPHVPSNERGVHKSVGGLDGGACLDHNEGSYKKDSCCYRYQAKNDPRAGKYKAVYEDYVLRGDNKNLRQRVARFRREGVGDTLETNQYPTEKGGVYPSATDYSDQLDLPEQKGDWDLDGPKRLLASVAKAKKAKKKKIHPGKNFTKAFWPYWNNAHHLISKGTFADRIAGIVELDTRKLVQVGLLRSMYNINHHKNVVFLPMDEEVGQLVLLPRHLTLGGASIAPDPNPFFDHKAYNALVDGKLTTIIDDYCAEVRKARKGKKLCDVVKVVKLSIDKLEGLSESCFETIRKAKPGAALVDIKKLKPLRKKR